ncbi:MAG TPA: hypothetical protein VK503_08670 [Candidatus Bathyarchaeia archaeon]|nr:hypothetical protein [Candidatus Bathyarchaeia archaeon]
MDDKEETAWSIFKLNLSRMPWHDFVLGMLIPLLLVQFVSLPSIPLLGVYCAIAWPIIVIVTRYVMTRTLSVFAIITLIVTVTIVAGRYLASLHPAFTLIPSLDATIIGLLFVGSMLRPRPFVMTLIGKETIERTEKKFGKSKYWYKAWFDINIMWGMFYMIQGVIISYLMILNLEIGNIMNALFGWPSVLVLLYVSVDYPRRYWKKNWEEMRNEIAAAELYEKSQASR